METRTSTKVLHVLGTRNVILLLTSTSASNSANTVIYTVRLGNGQIWVTDIYIRYRYLHQLG